MPENRQFRQRLEAWKRELQNQIAVPLRPLAFLSCPAEGRRLSPREAAVLPFAPLPVGSRWGGHREYRWFMAEAELPAEWAGQRIQLRSGLGGEQLVYLNNQALGSIDAHHPAVTLFADAPGPARVHLLVESYAGNGPRLENYGPCPPGRKPEAARSRWKALWKRRR